MSEEVDNRILRSLKERVRDIVNVKDFGAVGDGETDDTNAFQRAADTLNYVFVPFGSYNLSSNINGNFFSIENITITGTGKINNSNIIYGEFAYTVHKIFDEVISGTKTFNSPIVADSYVTSQGSTESRLLSDRFSDIINVKDFGAKGDGVTDDTNAFQSLALSGKVIFVPEGTYKINLSINSDNFFSFGSVNIVGNGSINIVNILNIINNIDDGIDNTAQMIGGDSLITSSNAESICNSSLSNLSSNTIYTVNLHSGISDMPVNGYNGLVATLSRGPSRYSGISNLPAATTQIFIPQSSYTSTMFYRIKDSTSYSKWRGLIPVGRLKLLGLGDSICRGVYNDNKGFVGELGFPYANFGISGWRLSNTGNKGPIADQLDTFAAAAADSSSEYYGFVPDAIIANGGINDLYANIPLGTVPTSPVDSSTDTVIGGLQHLLYKMITMYPLAKRIFVLIHRIASRDGSVYYPTTSLTAYNQTQLSEALAQTCKVYGCEVVDVFNNGQMDTKFDYYLGDYENNPNSEAWCNIDRLHPLKNGYRYVYCPLILRALTGCLSNS